MQEIIENPSQDSQKDRSSSEAGAIIFKIMKDKKAVGQNMGNMRNMSYVLQESEQLEDYHQECYYTLLGVSLIEAFWIFRIKENRISVRVSYSTVRTLGLHLKVLDSRTYSEVIKGLNNINFKLAYSEMKFFLDDLGIICLETHLFFKISKRTESIFKKAIASVEFELKKYLPSLICYLTKNTQLFYPKGLNNSQNNTDLLHQMERLEKIRVYSEKYQNIRQPSKEKRMATEKIVEETNRSSQLVLGVKSISFKKKERENQTGTQLDERYRLNEEKSKTGIGQQNANRGDIGEYIATFVDMISEPEKSDEVEISSGIFAKISLGLYSFILTSSLTTGSKDSVNNKEQERKKPVKSYLVKKTAIPAADKGEYSSRFDEWCFSNEKNLIDFIRNERCQFISQYYMIKGNDQKLFLPWYRQSLFGFLQKERTTKIKVSLSLKVRILIGVIKAIKFLVENRLLHRDLKPGNIMISKNGMPKLIDFGSCSQLLNNASFKVYNTPLISTPGYFFEYNQLPTALKTTYKNFQYNRHPNFDCYGLGTVIKDIFSRQLLSAESDLMRNISYLKERCHAVNPSERMTPFEMQIMVEEMISFLTKQEAFESDFEMDSISE